MFDLRNIVDIHMHDLDVHIRDSTNKVNAKIKYIHVFTLLLSKIVLKQKIIVKI